MSKHIEVEGDKPKVERTVQYFAALRAGLKTAEETSHYLERELDAQKLMLTDERRWRAEAEDSLRNLKDEIRGALTAHETGGMGVDEFITEVDELVS